MKGMILKSGMILIIVLIGMSSEAQVAIKRLIVFDQAYPDYQALAAQKTVDDVVLILPVAGNPIDYISEALKNSPIDEIHVYALTKPNAIVFNALALTVGSTNDFVPNLEKWKLVLKPSCILVIHSNVLEGNADGVQLVNTIRTSINCEVVIKP